MSFNAEEDWNNTLKVQYTWRKVVCGIQDTERQMYKMADLVDEKEDADVFKIASGNRMIFKHDLGDLVSTLPGLSVYFIPNWKLWGLRAGARWKKIDGIDKPEIIMPHSPFQFFNHIIAESAVWPHEIAHLLYHREIMIKQMDKYIHPGKHGQSEYFNQRVEQDAYLYGAICRWWWMDQANYHFDIRELTMDKFIRMFKISVPRVFWKRASEETKQRMIIRAGAWKRTVDAMTRDEFVFSILNGEPFLN